MGELIIPRFGRMPERHEDPKLLRAREHDTTQTMLLREEADAIRRQLNAPGRVDRQTREHFARYCHTLFEELDQLGRGSVKEVIAAVFPKEGDPSKRRARFSKIGPDAHKHLSATGANWAAIATEAGRKLGREHRALIDMVVGTKYAVNSEARSLTDLNDAALETAGLLNRMVAACVRKNHLGDYFDVLRHSMYQLHGEEVTLTSVVPEAADMDRLADGLWIDTETEDERAFLPKVDLYTRSLYLDALGTQADLPSEAILNAYPDSQKAFDELDLAAGTEECGVELQLNVAIGIAPIGRNRASVGCFIVEPRAFVTIVGQRIEIFPTADDSWIAVPHDGRCSGVRVRSWPRTSHSWSERVGHYLIETINRESCLRWLPGTASEERSDFAYKVGGWDVEDPQAATTIAPTSAPSASVMAVVQANLAWLPREEKLSTLLDDDAERLVSLVAGAQAEGRRRYREALRPLEQEWEGHNEK